MDFRGALFSLLVLFPILFAGCSAKSPGNPLFGRAPASDHRLAMSANELALAAVAASGYTTSGDCGGYPKLAHLKTPPGICVGLVATGFKMPRGILEFDPVGYPNQFLVTDMGSWEPNTGILWLVRPAPGIAQFEKIRLLEKLDLPHSIVLGAEAVGSKRAWLATATQILRVNVTGLDSPTPRATKEVVIDALPGHAPAGQNYRHPLKTIVFDRAKSLWVNVGSHSNNCEGENIAKNVTRVPSVLCQESDGPNPNGSIRKYTFDWSLTPPRVKSSAVVARGLRNSVALTAHPRTGLILQAENGRDAIDQADPKLSDDTLPHEEINVIREGKHYGWPYCYDDGATSPEFVNYRTRAACATRERPAILIPAHAAPLGMVHYRRSLFPEWYRDKLLVALHGYRATGHRIVVFDTKEDGTPFGDSYDLVSGWEARDGQPLGSPVSLSLAKDGAVYIVEDKNRTLLRIFYDPSGGDGIPKPSAPIDLSTPSTGESTEVIAERCRVLGQKKTAWAEVQARVIDVSCISCHRSGDLQFRLCDDVGSAEMLLRAREGRDAYVVPGHSEKSAFYTRMISAGAPMPPYPSADEKGVLVKMIPNIKVWIDDGAKVDNSIHD